MTTPPPAAAPQPGAPLTATEDNQWASFAHLGGILSFLPPLIIWLLFKDRGSFTDKEAKESLNFQITLAIAWVALWIVTGILTAVTFGFFSLIAWVFFLALWVYDIVVCIQAFNVSKTGTGYSYPITLRLIK
jgi:uncharacterized Tic20 family protein